MKNDICTAVIERFLASDKNKPLPLVSPVHCLRCAECRTIIKKLRSAEAAAKSAHKSLLEIAEPDNPVIMQIMQRIDATHGYKSENPVHTISLTRWISAGCILIAAIVLFGLFSAADAARQMQVLLYLCFALFVTGYCAFFVGSNLNFFIKKIQAIRPV